jgi:hypothetical protein
MVFEKLFHEDQPMGGGGTAIRLGALCACKVPELKRSTVANARVKASVAVLLSC